MIPDDERRTMILNRLEERRLSHCIYEVKDGAGSYCSCISAQGVHGHIFYRSECLGIPGHLCKVGSKYIPNEDRGLRIIVCGSRTYGVTKLRSTNYHYPSDSHRAMQQRRVMLQVLSYFTDYTLLCGMAHGADEVGHHLATTRGATVEEYPADWDRYGKSAGYRRNTQMLEAGPYLVLAFYDRIRSKGTQMMVRIAREAGVPTVEFGLEEI